MSFWPLLAQLRTGHFIDLTHAFDEHIPAWEGFPPMTMRDVLTLEEHGIWSQEFCHVGQYGTHFDPPAHLATGVRFLDDVAVREFLLPLCVIDMHEAAAVDPDLMLTVDHIRAWEAEHDRVPEGAFFAMRTDWSKRWPDHDRIQGRDADGVTHWPGFELETLQFLLHERRITALGHETVGTDGGMKTAALNIEGQRYISEQDTWQIELMTNLDQLPPTGALIAVGVPKARGGSGFPVRAFAIAPQ
ncbi:MAG: cyclase family protein [Chloroflexota bacterium]